MQQKFLTSREGDRQRVGVQQKFYLKFDSVCDFITPSHGKPDLRLIEMRFLFTVCNPPQCNAWIGQCGLCILGVTMCLNNCR